MVDIREELALEVREHLENLLRKEEELEELYVYRQSDLNLMVAVAFKLSPYLLKLLVMVVDARVSMYRVADFDRKHLVGYFELLEPDSVEKLLGAIEGEIRFFFFDGAAAIAVDSVAKR